MKTKQLTLMALMVAFVSVAAQITIPIKPVPFTLQTMLIIMGGLILGSKKGAFAIIIYVLVGAVGVPVFAGFSGGIGVVFMQTGGFIMSFPLMAFVAGYFDEKFEGRLMKYAGCFLGSGLNLAIGCAYFMFFTKLDLMTSLGYTVFPYLITNTIQIIFAVEFSKKINTITNLKMTSSAV